MKKTKSLFKTIESNREGFSFEYSYGTQPKRWQIENSEDSNEEACYFVEEQLVVKYQEDIKIMSVDTLATFIKKHNVIFYTGAGISAAAGIFTMHELEDALGLSGKDISHFLKKNDLNNPKHLINTFKAFCDAMLNKPPTKAHECLTKIAEHKECKIVTENMDNLHQRTGIRPYTIQSNQFKKMVKNKWANDIDAIICCGLSHDDRGFLGWYKKNNLNGIIVAIDLGMPSYLGKNDYLLTGDLQVITPQICNMLTK